MARISGGRLSRCENGEVPYREYSFMERHANKNGWVDPYLCESKGIPYEHWKKFIGR